MTNLIPIGSRVILGKTVAAYGTVENPLFDPADIAECLNYNKSNISKMIANVAEDEKVLLEQPTVDSYNSYESKKQGNLRTKRWFFTEFGLYETLMRSKKPQAMEFKKGVKQLLHDLRTGKARIDRPLTSGDLNLVVMTEFQKKVADLTQTVAIQQAKIEEYLPKVMYSDAVAASDSCISVAQLAMILFQNGVNIGRNRLFAVLRDEGFLYKIGISRNCPTQYAMKLGLFRVNEIAITNSKGKILTRLTTTVTGRGKQYFIRKFLSNPQLAKIAG